jgi:hypothetical protein
VSTEIARISLGIFETSPYENAERSGGEGQKSKLGKLGTV